MEKHVIVGNVIALISAIVMVCVGLLKEKKKILYVQNIQMIIAAISNLVLGGISGVISNLIGVIRNTLCYKNKFGIKEKLIISILATLITIYFNNLGMIGLLPLVSTLLYIAFMNTESVVKFKILIIVTLALWLVHDFYIQSFVYVVFDFGAIASNLLSIIQIKKLDKNS